MKISKQVQLSWKSMCTTIFMTSICLYMIIEFFLSSAPEREFYYVPIAFIIHGVILFLVATGIWTLLFGYEKPWNFTKRILIFLSALVILFAVSIFFPSIRHIEGYHLWLGCSFIVTLGTSVGYSLVNEKQFRKTGKRCALIWELLE